MTERSALRLTEYRPAGVMSPDCQVRSSTSLRSPCGPSSGYRAPRQPPNPRVVFAEVKLRPLGEPHLNRNGAMPTHTLAIARDCGRLAGSASLRVAPNTQSGLERSSQMAEKSDLEKGIEGLERQGREGTINEKAERQLKEVERLDSPTSTSDKGPGNASTTRPDRK